MQILSLIWGILAIIGMFIGFLPFLGALNWLNVPFSGIGLAVSIIALITSKKGNKCGSICGIICCSIAIMLGTIRLIIGGGIF